MKGLLLICGLLMIWPQLLNAETPSESVAKVEAKWKAEKEGFSRDFWLFSHEVAKKQGVAIIPAVMERAKSFKGEEPMIFVPLLALLPREKALKKLKEYQKGSDETLKLWAEEFITEFEMSDTVNAVKEFQSRQSDAVKAAP